VRGQLGLRKAGEGCPTASRRRRRAALVSSGVPAGIGGRLGVGEHERRSGKLVRGSVRAMGAREWLSTTARGSPEGMKGGRWWCSGSRCTRQRKGDGNGSGSVYWFC
jgi:hypothetical protein